MVAGETTFWSNLIYAKWFGTAEQKDKADLLLERFGEAVRTYRVIWMINYGNYWGAGMWGLDRYPTPKFNDCRDGEALQPQRKTSWTKTPSHEPC